jgi:rubredoxin
MSMKEKLNRILIKGGILAPIELIMIIEFLNELGQNHLHFGSRQDILFHSDDSPEKLNEQSSIFKSQHFDFKENRFQNIACSYLSTDIFPTIPWLTGATYLHILEEFRYHPVLRISIVDPRQQIVPLFYSHLNFIASDHEDYWYLYINMPEAGLEGYFPVLLFSSDLYKIASYIENNYPDFESVPALFQEAMTETGSKSRTFKNELRPQYVPFPYYEGMNKMGLDKYWLGLYWRNNRYALDFLRAMCDLCIESKVGKICITPWKSFIVKGIPAIDKLKWEKFLGYHGINVRHSSLELNWHLPVGDAEAIDLKNYIVRFFDQNDISTYGLTFSISSATGYDFTSIVIQKNPPPSVLPQHSCRTSYNILHSRNFDPNTRRYETFCQEVDKMELPGLLIELTKKYFNQLGEVRDNFSQKPVNLPLTIEKSDPYQCTVCFTVYDSQYGDESQGIPANTLFKNLPDNFYCPVCHSPREFYLPVSASHLLHDNNNKRH